ncbi:hypothetical protein H6P81_006419 [Aristolochia fimbriata]|uniref:Protein kinase domain-containing protein n=1 Tax=Aristolochia fimbriata TaxID=158543 RepID=A0AAV7EX91_ARIFI|nr:hypothetical protein H6P81_006419 [Aristolochia fimbriata]
MEQRKSNWSRGACIGRGSFGTVNLAVNRVNRRVFAVKSVRVGSSSVAPAVDALEREIEIVRSLDSPFVVRYLGDDRTEEGPTRAEYRNLHLEYMGGGTVTDAAARGELRERAIRSYTRSLLRALEYLHARGLVHCDVKGRNVLLGPSGAKLADLGSSWRVSTPGGGGGEGGGGDGWMRGTPLWMAPEVMRGEAPEPAADVWSLGCTLIEMVTGKAPWSEWSECGAMNATEAMCRIGFLQLLPKFPSRLSATGLDFLEKCLRRDAGERWTCEQLLQHPFLDSTAGIEQSPRSVLDGIEPEIFHEDESEDSEDSGPESSTCGPGDPDSLITARDRIAQLACKREIDWESEGWEVVRGPPQVSGSEREDEENDRRGERREEMRVEYSSTPSSERSEGDYSECDYVSSGGGFSCAECCSCCYCCCYRAGFCCQHGWGEKDMGKVKHTSRPSCMHAVASNTNHNFFSLIDRLQDLKSFFPPHRSLPRSRTHSKKETQKRMAAHRYLFRTKKKVPSDSMHQKITPSDSMHQKITPSDSMHQKITPSDSMHQKITPSDSMHQKITPSDSMHQKITPSDSMHQKITPSDSMHQKITPSDSMLQKITVP